MNAKEHINFNNYSVTLLIAGFAINKYIALDNQQITLLLVGAGVGTLLPDIDHQNSTLGKLIPLHIVHKLLKKIGIHAFKHGGITHTLVVTLLIAGFGVYYKNYFVVGLSFGYFNHLYADDITGNKLSMMYWPIKRRR